MGHETGGQFHAEFAEQQAQYDPMLLDQFGLGPEEANTVVSYGNYTGTLASVLTDERCPVGGVVADAYQKEGLAGVEQKLTALQMMSPDFSITISEKTRAFHEGSLSRDELVAHGQPPERPDFLA